MDTDRLDALIQRIYFTVDPITAVPYVKDKTPVADGQGLYRWQTVFQSISSQSATDGAPLGYLPQTIRSLGQTESTLSTTIAANFVTLNTSIANAVRPGDLATFSTFTFSTVTYAGNNGAIAAAVTANSNLGFSTATIPFASFSNYITPTSRITVEVVPNFLFSPITNGATTTKVVPMTTRLQYSNAYVGTAHTTQIYANSADPSAFSNTFQQPIRLTFSGSNIAGNYANPYVLYHSLQGGFSFSPNVGFTSSNLTAHFAPTNSVFISIENR